MVNDVADGALSTCSRAGVYATKVAASFVRRTVSVHCTFGAATAVGISLVLWQTRADAVSALSIGTTRRRIAWIQRYFRFFLFDFGCTLSEWVSDKSGGARTDGNVVLDSAFGVETAGTRTRVSTLLGNASLVRGTVRVYHTFGSAAGWRSYIVRQARTRRLISYCSAG